MVSLAMTGLTGHTEGSFKASMTVIWLMGQIWGAFIVSELKNRQFRFRFLDRNSSKSDTLVETRQTDSSQSATLAGSEQDKSSEIASSAGSELGKC